MTTVGNGRSATVLVTDADRGAGRGLAAGDRGCEEQVLAPVGRVDEQQPVTARDLGALRTRHIVRWQHQHQQGQADVEGEEEVHDIGGQGHDHHAQNGHDADGQQDQTQGREAEQAEGIQTAIAQHLRREDVRRRAHHRGVRPRHRRR